jgi:hypothetical protein
MANKYMKKCSTPLAIQGMEIKTTLRFLLTPIKMATIKKKTGGRGRRWPKQGIHM